MTKAKRKSQTGWTTMEYVVGAIALVGVVTLIINTFSDKLIGAINALQLI
jgi:hypothetical protein